MINELITNINSDKHNIIIGEPKVYAISYYKIGLYNADINHPLHKFWFFIPKAKIIDRTPTHITVALTTSDYDKKFLEYLNKLQNKVLACFKNSIFDSIKNIKISFNTGKNLPTTVKLDIRNDIPIFDENEEELDSSHLKVNSLISIILELDNIVASTSEAWIVWKVLQIKKFNCIDLKKSLFKMATSDIRIHSGSSVQQVSQSIPPPPPPPPLPPVFQVPKLSIPVKKDVPNNNVQKTSRFEISEVQIIDQINKLKKVKLDKEEKKEQKEPELPYNINELKKVETKLPLSTEEWYNKSLELELFTEIYYGSMCDELIVNIDKLNLLLQNKLEKMNNNFEQLNFQDQP
ncbi:hypothetical protein Catovirus_2_154 [Catovirus CTV1]|uniref:Uncharacterized protein n=1 Tax=Catovirus CTV1 TaxID=1977631 RepID=A0A1V0SBW5_9VIRU|nr:hypothetical protein Catovirus_2_154 [Catovirus CTV1]